MKLVRYQWQGESHWGIYEEEHIFRLEGDLYGAFRRGKQVCSLSQAKLLAPISPTNKIVAIGHNWSGKEDRDGPGIFIKPLNTVIATGEPIVFPKTVKSIIYEGELGGVMKRQAKEVNVAQALDYVLGYTGANDVTVREFLLRDFIPTIRQKLYDTFCPLGPMIETDLDCDQAHLITRVNGVVKQDAITKNMTWKVPELIAWVSQVMTLWPGDIIICGSPPPLELIHVGAVVEVEIEGIGVLRNPVVSAQ